MADILFELFHCVAVLKNILQFNSITLLINPLWNVYKLVNNIREKKFHMIYFDIITVLYRL